MKPAHDIHEVCKFLGFYIFPMKNGNVGFFLYNILQGFRPLTEIGSCIFLERQLVRIRRKILRLIHNMGMLKLNVSQEKGIKLNHSKL